MRPRSRKLAATVAKLDRQPSSDPQWGWVLTEVTVPDQIRHEHRQAACGFAPRNALQKPLCPNKFFPHHDEPALLAPNRNAEVTLDNDPSESSVVEISEDDVSLAVPCSKKSCRTNPNCLNYLGQSKWNAEARARDAWLEASMLGGDPSKRANDVASRKPIGLKNLGATCYANAFLQVWFQDLTFRTGVYRCLSASHDEGDSDSNSSSSLPEVSPIYQLQVTFAALQNLKENVFNPVRLVESLHLKVSEQQDAQEFSKLFMSLLSEEFQRQSVTSLKSLVSDQFGGTQVYGTRCKTCNYRSEREADFFELEVNFQKTSNLEDCIHRLLESETLSSDNQYFCPKCDSLQDAVRYTELKRLPPVLHFSLLRFVYDVNTGSRKKSKHNIIFPTVLDMQAFVGEGSKGASSEKSSHSKPSNGRHRGSEIYELRGILLHQGPSAYHGHYQAQVFDVTKQAWFEFNDEVVTPIDLFNAPAMNQPESDKQNGTALHGRGKRARRTMVLSDEDEILTHTPALRNDALKGYLGSKDAYMLIYSRCKLDPDESPGLDPSHVDPSRTPPTIAQVVPPHTPAPPFHASREIDRLNAAFDREVQRYEARKRKVLHEFKQTRKEKMDIYRMWHIGHHSETSIVVSSKVLEDWLADSPVIPAIEVAMDKGHSGASPSSITGRIPVVGPPSDGQASHMFSPRSSLLPSDDSSKPDIPSVDPMTKESGALPIFPADVLTNRDIVCCHGRLDPAKFAHMKRINTTAYERMVKLGGRRLSPELLSRDVCIKCIEVIFYEKMYLLEHPGKVEEFDHLNETAIGERSVLISRAWLRDWHLKIPKFHNSNPQYVGDPPPDAFPWRSHIFCEHGDLKPNHANRSMITQEAASVILDLFPAWETISGTQTECQICTQILTNTFHDHSAMKRAADLEKARFRGLKNPLDPPDFVSGVSFAVIPSHFIRAWRLWINKPTQHGRPSLINNQHFICEHGLLIFDPKVPSDLVDPDICFIQWEDWQAFAENYETAHPILIDVDGEDAENITADIETCQGCRSNRMGNFNQAIVTIQIMEPSDPVPTSELDNPAPTIQAGGEDSLVSTGSSVPDVKSNPKKRAAPKYFSAPTRKSKRIRQTKEKATRNSLLLTKTNTVKDLKVKIHEQLDIPPIYQKLYYCGRELTDNYATVDELGILALDTIFLRSDTPSDKQVLFVSDHDDVGNTHEGNYSAFSGTLLAGVGLNRGVTYRGTKQVRCEEPCSSLVELGSPLSPDTSGITREVDADVEHTHPTTPAGNSSPEPETVCSACTFINPGGLSACIICDGMLDI